MSKCGIYRLTAPISRAILLVATLHLCACDVFTVEINGRKISGVAEERYPAGMPHYIRLKTPQTLYAGDRAVACVDTYNNSSTISEPDGNMIGYALELHENGSLKLAYPGEDIVFTAGGTDILFRKMGYMRFYRSGKLMSGFMKKDTVIHYKGGALHARAGYVSFYEDGSPASLKPTRDTMLRRGTTRMKFRKERIVQLYPDGSAAAGTLVSDSRFSVRGGALEFIAVPGESESVPSAVNLDGKSSWMEPSHGCTVAFHLNGSIKSGFYMQVISIADPMMKYPYRGKVPVLIEVDEHGIVRKGRIVITPEIAKYAGGMMPVGSKDFGEDYNRSDGSYDPPVEMALTIERTTTTFKTYR